MFIFKANFHVQDTGQKTLFIQITEVNLSWNGFLSPISFQVNIKLFHISLKNVQKIKCKFRLDPLVGT